MTHICYEDRIHKSVPTTSKSKTHYMVEATSFIPTGKIPKTDQVIQCMFCEGGIVKHNNEFYNIIPESEEKPYKPITTKVDGKIEVHYKIRLLVDRNTISGKVEENHSKIVNQDVLTSLTKKEEERVRTVSFYLNRYNAGILSASSLNRDHSVRTWKNSQFNERHPPHLLSLPETLPFLEETKIRPSKLSELVQHIRQTHRSELQLLNVLLNPFLYITPEWQLFNFDSAWFIANKRSIMVPSEVKMEAWVYSLVHEKQTFYIRCKDMVVDYQKSKYKIHGNAQRSLLSNEILVQKTIDGLDYYTTQDLMDLEKELSDLIVDLFYGEPIYLGISEEIMNILINEFESEPGRFTLNDQQRAAVKNCLYKRLSIITGFPGTGKTTIMECVFYIRARINKLENVSVSAPTGIAYKNISDKLSEIKIGDKKVSFDSSASGTLHKCVYINYPNILNSINSDTKVYTKDIIDYHLHREQKKKETGMTDLSLCVIDEVSMVDIFIFKRVLLFCKKFGCQLILIGDSNQLPSIGPGTVLKSILESEIFDDNIVKLNKICRQNTGALLNGILKMANGDIIGSSDFDKSSLYFLPISEYEGDRFNVRKFFDLFDEHSLTKDNTKVVCFNSSPKFPINTVDLNIILQARYNRSGIVICSPFEDSSKMTKFRFRVGDSIMLCQNGMQPDNNGEEKYRVNGDGADIMDTSSDLIKIRYIGDNESSFTQISTNTLYSDYSLAYALTVHKSQGSQYPNIIFMPGDSPFVKKELVFTAISRATQNCFVLANMDSFKLSQTKTEKKPTILMKEFITTSIS